MLIANPIYDTVFKHLLENEKVAKFFIGTLLGKTVHSIALRSPEHTYIDPKDKELKLLRMDFTVEPPRLGNGLPAHRPQLLRPYRGKGDSH